VFSGIQGKRRAFWYFKQTSAHHSRNKLLLELVTVYISYGGVSDKTGGIAPHRFWSPPVPGERKITEYLPGQSNRTSYCCSSWEHTKHSLKAACLYSGIVYT